MLSYEPLENIVYDTLFEPIDQDSNTTSLYSYNEPLKEFNFQERTINLDRKMFGNVNDNYKNLLEERKEKIPYSGMDNFGFDGFTQANYSQYDTKDHEYRTITKDYNYHTITGESYDPKKFKIRKSLTGKIMFQNRNDEIEYNLMNKIENEEKHQFLDDLVPSNDDETDGENEPLLNNFSSNCNDETEPFFSKIAPNYTGYYKIFMNFFQHKNNKIKIE
jgi:hypothetical protein